SWNLLPCISLVLARSGHASRVGRCPLSGAKQTTLESKPERGPGRRFVEAGAGGHAVRTARSWRGIVPFTHPRTGRAQDSTYWTAGIAGGTGRRGGHVAARCARATARDACGRVPPPLHGRRAQTWERFSGERRPA